MGMYSLLPHVVVSSQEWPDRPPTMWYTGRAFEKAICWNGEETEWVMYPGFRLACMIEFVCEPKKLWRGGRLWVLMGRADEGIRFIRLELEL